MNQRTGRRTFLKRVVASTGAALLTPVLSYPSSPHAYDTTLFPQNEDFLHTIPLNAVRLRGYLGEKIDRCIENRIKAQDINRLVQPFSERPETWCWTSEFWGKWFISAVDAYRYSNDPQLGEIVKTSLQQLLATQTPDGYIGSYNETNRLSNWDVWGRKYTLLGLLSFYDETKDESVLDAARRLADHLMTEVGPDKKSIVHVGLYRGMPSSSILEPVVLLYSRTGEKKYLDFAEYIVREWSIEGGPDLIGAALAGVPVGARFPQPDSWWTWENGHKAYEMMSCYEGLLELFRITGEPTYATAVIRAFVDIRSTEINIAGSGASMECWYGGKERQVEPARHMMETCVTTTWMKLCHNLLRLTGDPQYADEVELSGYNALLGAMTPNGSTFAKYSPLAGHRELGEDQCNMHLNCCTANGPRGIMLLPQTAVMLDSDGPVINLFSEGDAVVPLASGNHVRIELQTDYPASGRVSLRINPDRQEEFTLSIRIPSWSAHTVISTGNELVSVEPGTYARLRRTWKPGDEIQLELDMRGRLVRSPGNRFVHTAVLTGPILMTRDLRLNPQGVDEVVTPEMDETGYVPLEPVTSDQHAPFELVFRVPFRNGEHDRTGTMLLCDYASAGNTWGSDSRYRVWLPQRVDPSNGA